MRDLGSLIIVHLVEERPEGMVFRRARGEWPLHITLAPWFAIAENERGQFLKALQLYCANKTPFVIQVGDEELFGPGKDVPVNLIVEQEPVIRLHDELTAIVRQYDLDRDRSNKERVYRAHITHHNGADGIHQRFPGDKEDVNSLTVVRLLDDNGVQMCEIIQNLTFGKGNHEAAA